MIGYLLGYWQSLSDVTEDTITTSTLPGIVNLFNEEPEWFIPRDTQRADSKLAA